MDINSFRFKTELTKKNLGFINNVDLRNDLVTRLQELGRVVKVNAHYSTVFLAVSIIEGIFRHVAEIYKTEIQSSPNYTIHKKQIPKEFDELLIEELYIQLRELNIVPPEPDFEKSFELFRKYRNFIHPHAWKKKRWKVGLGQAQMAMGLLNSTIQNLEINVFIDKHILEIISGSPSYDMDGVLLLPKSNTRHHSFVVFKQPLKDKLEIDFDLNLSHGSLLNFVFNYIDEANFLMVRLDSRTGESFSNMVLESSQKQWWVPILWAVQKSPPKQDLFSVRINIDVPNSIFDFIVNGETYIFMNDNKEEQSLHSLLKKDLRVGFFNEVGPVKLKGIEIYQQ